MAQPNIQIIGLADFKSKIKTTSAILSGQLQNLIIDAALETESEAKKITPVDTGRLRASIHTEKVNPLQYAVGTNVDYASAVERTQPYLFPAYLAAVTKLNSKLRGLKLV